MELGTEISVSRVWIYPGNVGIMVIEKGRIKLDRNLRTQKWNEHLRVQ